MESTIDSKGRVTIPKAVREQLGLRPGDRVRFFVLRDGHAVLLPTRPVSTLRGIVEGGQGPVTVEQMEEATVDGAINGAVDRRRWSALMSSTPAHGSGLWPARGQAPAGAHPEHGSRPAPG